jgi:hypothetical protein
MSDMDRWEFLAALDRSDVNVTKWEADFIKSRLQWARAKFTPKQAEAIDKMIDKYGQRIGW